MAHNTDFFDEFEPHTLLKLRILRAYLGTWAMRLIQWGRAGHQVTVVDAFAGPGRDKTGNEGSPMIAAKIAAQTQAALRSRGIIEATVRVIGIEKMTTRFRALTEYMAPLQKQDATLFEALRGELSDHIDKILQETRGAPTLYFLDPFGVKGLDAATYTKMLSGHHDEVFVLFADMGAVRLHGVVSADRPDLEAQLAALRARPSLFPEIDMQEEESLRRRVLGRQSALDLTAPASGEHLTRALGGDEWQEELAGVQPEERAEVFLQLFIMKLIEAGAVHVLTVPMRDDSGRRIYTLVHASKSASGFVAMKEAVHTGLNNSSMPAEICDLMRDDLMVPVALCVQHLEHNYAGLEVPWREKGSKDSVTRFVLENTPMFPFQLEELKMALVDAGHIERSKTGKPKRPIRVRFVDNPD